MATVIREERESFEALLGRFRKAVQNDRILSIARRQRFYEKPSQARKRKAARKLRKSRRTTRRMHRYREARRRQ